MAHPVELKSLLAARKGLKVCLKLSRGAVEKEIEDFRKNSAGTKPWELEERIVDWQERFDRYKANENKYSHTRNPLLRITMQNIWKMKHARTEKRVQQSKY